MFLEESKYIAKAKKVTRYITEDLEISLDSDEADKNKLWGKFAFAKGKFNVQTRGKVKENIYCFFK